MRKVEQITRNQFFHFYSHHLFFLSELQSLSVFRHKNFRCHWGSNPGQHPISESKQLWKIIFFYFKTASVDYSAKTVLSVVYNLTQQFLTLESFKCIWTLFHFGLFLLVVRDRWSETFAGRAKESIELRRLCQNTKLFAKRHQRAKHIGRSSISVSDIR